MPNVEWLLHAAASDHVVRVSERTEVDDEHWVGTIERLELEPGLRIYLVAAKLRRDMVLEPRTNATKPWLGSQISVAGAMDIEFPDGARTSVTPNHALLFRPVASSAIYRLTSGQSVRAAGYGLQIENAIRLFEGNVPASLRSLVEEGAVQTRMVEMTASPRIRGLANGLFAPGLNGPLRALFMEGTVLQLIALQANAVRQRQAKVHRGLSAKQAALVTEARERLLYDMRTPPSLGALAAELGLSERRLNAGFRSLFGMSAYELLRNERLEHARLALENEQVLLKDVAFRVGYNHVSNFIKAFTVRFGAPPRRYTVRASEAPKAL